MGKLSGISYQKRITEINRIYDKYAKSGLSNREIWRRYVHPIFGISERTFYNAMNAIANPRNSIAQPETPSLFDWFESTFNTKH